MDKTHTIDVVKTGAMAQPSAGELAESPHDINILVSPFPVAWCTLSALFPFLGIFINLSQTHLHIQLLLAFVSTYPPPTRQRKRHQQTAISDSPGAPSSLLPLTSDLFLPPRALAQH